MSDERSRIIKKVHGLLSKTVDNGCTENEAIAAAAKAGELMDFYNLEITDIEIRETKCRHLEIELSTSIGGKLDSCIVAIGRFCDTKTWYTRGRKSYTADNKPSLVRGAVYHFFGLEQDVEIVEYLYKILDAAIETELAAFKLSEAYLMSPRKKTATKTFCRSFSGRIYSRLTAMKIERVNELAKHDKTMERTGRSLVLVKQDYIEDEFDRDLGIKLSKRGRSSHTHDNNAARAGTEAAGRVSMNKGVGGSGAQALLA